MKILVVDDEQAFGALLGHTLKRLGHKPLVAASPQDALEMLTGDVDAVITDIDMPVMDGVELAVAIRERLREIPIAFCTGSSPDSSRLKEARRLGRVLPKIWTVADVRALVEELRRGCQEAADRTEELPSRELPSVPSLVAPPVAPPQRVRKVKIRLKTWDQVNNLCDSSGVGPVYLTVHGQGDLSEGVSVAVGLALPDEITVAIAGEVQAIRPGPSADVHEIVIELVGLTPELAERLRALSTPEPASHSTSYLQVARSTAHPRTVPRAALGTDVGDVASSSSRERRLARGSRSALRVSDMMAGNDRLRAQIEGLPAKMRPRRSDDDD